MKNISCMRCGREEEGFTEAPYPGPLGKLLLNGTCQKCWGEWQKQSVLVINEYKLRPFMPQDRATLEDQMKKFLNLEGQGMGQPRGFDGTTSAGVSKEKIIEMLSQIYDPEIPVNIYDLGLIYDVGISEGKVAIKMTLTTPHCPAAQSLPATVKEAISRIPGVKEGTVEVVWDPPWTREMISEEGRRTLGL